MGNQFIGTLMAETPHSAYAEKLEPYRPLIGEWNFEWKGTVDGREMRVPGQWIFSWVLEGRAIQDNWICPAPGHRGSGEYPEGEYGTTIRVYDFKDDEIKVFWFGPILSTYTIFRAKKEKGVILQEEIPLGEKQDRSRWLFRDITSGSFTWEAYVSKDGKRTWDLTQQVFAER